MTTIYHNPRCTKSRLTLQLLKDNAIEPEVIEYLNTPPSADALDTILTMLNKEPRDIMRRQEEEYKANGFDDASLSRDALINLMVKYPKVIERPIVVHEGKAAIGRPPENILEIL